MQKWKYISVSKLLLILFFLLGVLSFCFTMTGRPTIFWNVEDNQAVGTVVRVRKKDYGLEILIRSQGKYRLRVFYSGKQKLQLGDQILVKGEFQRPKKNTIPNGFNYAYYLWYHREFFVFEARSIQLVGQTRDPVLRVKRAIDQEISKRMNSKYLRLFLLGQNDDMGSEQEAFRMNGISHLFSISGMHFSFLAAFFSMLFSKRGKKSLVSFLITSFFLFLYLVLIDFLPSACRAFLFFELLTITRIAKWSFSRTYCFWLMILILLFWKPFYFFDVGFQFSVILSFFLCQRQFHVNDSKISRVFSFSLFTFFVSLPLVLRYFYQVNFLSIFLNMLFVPFVSFFFFPMQVLSFFLPFLSPFLFYVGSFFERLVSWLSTIDFFVVSFPRPLFVWILFYYILLFFSCFRRYVKVSFFGIFLLLFVLYHWNAIFLQSYFIMVDVGQGDCLLFHSNNQTMLVDTGGDYLLGEGEVYQRKLKPLLMSLGIHQINILCLSHGDFDHIGEAYTLLQEMKVGYVYFNNGSFSAIEEKVLRLLIQKKISYSFLEEGSSFQLGKFFFYSLNKEFPIENDSSSVLLGKIQNQFFLLSGDATVKTEQYIMEHYQLPEILFLKVGHHGSSTSTSLDLLKRIHPKYSLISVGVHNRYGHPNLEIIQRLQKYSYYVYMTSTSGSILIQFKKNVTFFLFPP